MDMGHGDTVQIAAKKIKIEVGKLLSKSELVSGTEQKKQIGNTQKIESGFCERLRYLEPGFTV